MAEDNTLTSIDLSDESNPQYFANGTQTDRSTYETTVGTEAQQDAEFRANGWSDEQIDQLRSQDTDFNDLSAEEEAAVFLTVDPVTGGPITEADLAAREEADAAEQQYAQKVADSEAKAAAENDWRVRLHLAPDANYLYKAPEPGILAPLNDTNGIIFPYTPQIAVQYNANYENYDLTHSNYRGYFYTGSQTQNILLTATFTANDLAEANYMLAALHFLRSATKMFYGQDDLNRGMPPPVVFLTGLGEYQFNNHPCAITMMNYNLPNDVDYIPCGKPSGVAPLPPAKVPANASPAERLKTIPVSAGGTQEPPQSSATTQGRPDPYNKATYVPTKIEINFTMIPIQTRDQVSKEFSLAKYASGELLTKGSW